METDMKLTPEQIPSSFARCFDTVCPLAGTCARYLAGQHVPTNWHEGPAVYPTARQGSSCACYKPTRIIHAAYGFKALFAEVKRKDDTPLRHRLWAYLGGSTNYYRYHRGERVLTPEQQEWIIALFHKYGYTENLHFDNYRDQYDFMVS